LGVQQTMVTAASIESMIVLDCGSTTTRAVLVDLVDGHYRFIARGETFNVSGDDEDALLSAVREVLHQIETVTGRAFLNDAGQLIEPERGGGEGVDALLVVADFNPPLRVILAGLSDHISLASARRAIRAAHAQIAYVISPESIGDATQTEETRLSLISALKPDAIILTGGVNGSPAEPVTNLATLITLGCSLVEEPSNMRLLYAGNEAIRDEIVETVGDTIPLTILDNVRPSLDEENLESLSETLDVLYRDRMLAESAGLATVARWSQCPITTSSQALGYVIKYLARMYGQGHDVLGVDIGGATTTAAFVIDETFHLVNSPDMGISRGISQVVARSGIERIARWLPVEIDADTARDRLLNKELRSSSLPQTLTDLYLEQAVAREALRLTLEQGQMLRQEQDANAGLSEFEIIIGSGGVLAHAPQHAQAALLLLDAIQPTGITTLWLDTTSLAIPVGTLATIHPVAATHVMEGDAFLNLGTAICPVGTGMPRPGDVVMRITITYSDDRTLDLEIPYGSLEVIPLPLGEKASLEARPLKGFDVGAGPGAKRKIKRLVGGMMGLIIDARGRPLQFPTDPTERLERVQRWYSGIGA